MNRYVVAVLLLASCTAQAFAQQSANSIPSACSPAAFVITEHGKIAGADWVEVHRNQLHTRTVLTQSRVIDATIDLRSDQTASHSSVVLSIAGGQPEAPKTRDLGDGAIYWSDMIPSSLEQVVARARVLNQSSVTVPGASLYADSRTDILVDRVDATDWVVNIHNKRYQVLTDAAGCMLSAILPEYGVIIERRTDFTPEQYPLWSPYGAAPDKAYTATEVSIPAPQGHVLTGTLTMPLTAKPAPAAVLITGLSPSERNGGQPPWMPLRDLADALTRAGLAVLRVDDRGIGKSTGDHAPSTTLDEADDIQTEVAWLRGQPAIDPTRIALIGYSEGGLIAPIVAARDPKIAAIVTLAGPGTSGADLAHYQIEQAVLHDPGIAPADRDKEIAKQLADPLTPREKSVLALDPIEFATRVKCPALIVQGGNDLHVPMRSSERIANAMRTNGNNDVTVRIFPGVSHSLLPDPVGMSAGWVYLPAFLTSPPLLDVISQWTAEKLRVHIKR